MKLSTVPADPINGRLSLRQGGLRDVSKGAATTVRVLAKTSNEAAVPVLIAALDSPRPAIREEALAAILIRRSPAGHREILRRLPNLSERWKSIIRKHPSRMTQTLRDALLGSDLAVCRTACRAAVWFHEYDLVPALLNTLEDQNNRNADTAAETLKELAVQLYDEVVGPRDEHNRRDPQSTRRHLVGILEESVNRFGRHNRKEVIEVFLLLAEHDNPTLRRILQNPHYPAFLAVMEILSKSEHGGVLQLLLSFFDDTAAPSAALTVAANRGDAKFVRHLVRKAGGEMSAAVAQNLKRIESFGWLRAPRSLIDQLDESGQRGLVLLVMSSGVSRPQAFVLIEQMLLYGKPGGRCEAARALAEFGGADANALALRALDDPDPQVQANVLGQVRRRGIPGILSRVVEMVDSRYAAVRQVARQCLTEFTFKRFVGAFDALDEEVRQSTGMLVKKIDPQTIPLLQEEMASRIRSRRLRALAIARVIDAVPALEEEVIELLRDEDHRVRVEAAAALAESSTEPSRHALQAALNDRSEIVQEAAKNALIAQEAFQQWQATLADPRD